MTDDSLLAFDLPTAQRKKVSAAFDCSPISSDGGLILLCEADRCLRVAETPAGCVRDGRNEARVVHSLSALLRLHMLATACGFEDGDGWDALRTNALLKLAVAKALQRSSALCSKPTMSGLENAPSRIKVARILPGICRVRQG